MDFSVFILGVKYFFKKRIFRLSHYFDHSSEDFKEIPSNAIACSSLW